VTIALIAANVGVFLLWQPTFRSDVEQFKFFLCRAETSWEVSHRESLAQGGAEAKVALDHDFGPGAGTAIQDFMLRRCAGKSWSASVLISMFLHEGWFHVATNMLFLWVFGNNVEDRLGRGLFALLYVFGGIAAMLLHLAFAPNSTIPTIGASGAIAAVLGAYLILFPRARITTLIVFFIIAPVRLPAWVALGGWFVLQLFSGVGGLEAQVNGGVAYWAHVGGFVFGGAAAWLFFRNRREPQPVLPPPPRPDLA
jgi:membrane associated rhomboid family serine protease